MNEQLLQVKLIYNNILANIFQNVYDNHAYAASLYIIDSVAETCEIMGKSTILKRRQPIELERLRISKAKK